MRSGLLTGSLIVAAVIVGLAVGQQPAAPVTSYSAVIVQAEAELRAGPGTDGQLYPTNRLSRGQTVEVLKDRGDGWLEVRPPAGSFSWINTRFVERMQNQPNWVVMNRAPVPVLIGSEVLKGRPSVEGPKLPQGTIVRSIGAPLADADGSWLPIAPPPSEVRYLRVEAISRTGAAPAAAGAPVAGGFPNPTATVAARVNPGPVAGSPTSFQAPTAAGSALAPLVDVDTLWQRAQQAERDGNVPEAIRLYNQVGAESARTNRELAIQAYNRAHWLRDANQGPASSTFTPAPAPAFQPAVRLTAPDATAAANAVWNNRPPVASDPSGLPSSGPGHLRRAGRSLDGHVTYVLDDVRGLPRLYVTPQHGVDLEPFVDRDVELFGVITYHGGLRANLMTAARVQPLR
jgi:hypothetical protein